MGTLDWKAIIDKGFAEPPEDVAAWLALGDTYLEMGRLDDAERAFQRAFELAPDNFECLKRLIPARAR